MSRTDKDRPWQLLALDRWPGSYFRHLCGNGRDCDADVDPLEAFQHAYDRPRPRYVRVLKSPQCGWTMPHASFSSPPHWYVRHVWHGPERVRERARLGQMVKEYNATGELADGDFANHQARHGAAWSYY